MDGNASGAGAGIARRWALVLIGSIFSGKFLPSLRADPSLGSGPAANDDALPLVSERKGIVTAGPVSRILSCLAAGTVIPLRRPSLNACSDLPGTFTHCWVPYRAGAPSRHAPGLLPDSSPIWSCSVWGLPCPCHYWPSFSGFRASTSPSRMAASGTARAIRSPGGALLPHLFTLTFALRRRRYRLCGTFRRLALTPASRTLSGTLLCGVRTFLQDRLAPLSATVRSDCQHRHYIRCHRRRTGPAKVDRQFWRRQRLRGKPAGCAARNPPMRSAVPARSPSA